MPNNPSREAFEQKFAPLGYTFGIDEDDGEYLFADTHHAWLGWQAGAQAERARVAELERQPMSDEQMDHMRYGFNYRNFPVNKEDFREYVRAIEAFHGIGGTK